VSCYYTVTCGGHELSFYASSDTKARAKASRWLRLFWTRYVASLRPGNLAAAFARDADFVDLYRRHVDSAGIISCHIAKIDTWTLEHNAYIAERYS
jgi:hypothetical protein